jgi:predicted ester cyclase
MSSTENIAIARRLLMETFSEGDLSIVGELVTADFIEHQNGIQGRGPEAVRRTVTGLRASFPDLHLEIRDIVADGDKVWVRVRGTGTDRGGVAGRPPSGRPIELDVIDIVRVRDGRVCEHWGVADRLGMLQQVGAVPRPPAA